MKLADELNKLQEQGDQYELKVANALWAEQTYPFSKSYFATVNAFYHGGAFPMDYRGNPEGSRLKINAWVEEKTNNRIKDLLPRGSVTRLTRLVLTNAVYFKGEWSAPFDPKNTKDQSFFLADGKKVTAPLMSAYGLKGESYLACNGDGTTFETPERIGFTEKEDKFYPDSKGFQLLEMPYKGGDLAMLVLVPRDASGLNALEKLLTPERL